jgi:hypothetical protein
MKGQVLVSKVDTGRSTHGGEGEGNTERKQRNKVQLYKQIYTKRLACFRSVVSCEILQGINDSVKVLHPTSRGSRQRMLRG